MKQTHTIAGRTIATRINGNVEGDNRLFYIYSDHPASSLGTGLGSTSVMSDAGGNKVPDSTAHSVQALRRLARRAGP